MYVFICMYIKNITKRQKIRIKWKADKQKNNNDVILTQILNNNDYICRQPMLGYENEEGGSTFRLMTV